MVGTRDASLMPECTRAWGIRVGTIVAPSRSPFVQAFAGKTLENLRENGRIAVTCTRPTDHITCQLKGRVRSMKPVTSANRDTSRRGTANSWQS